jgi:predicted Fe-S protein YdhL (DUF1289 family)
VSDIQSPCRNVCVLDAKGEICTGCGRTLNEIAVWSSLTPAQREIIMRRLSARAAASTHE